MCLMEHLSVFIKVEKEKKKVKEREVSAFVQFNSKTGCWLSKQVFVIDTK